MYHVCITNITSSQHRLQDLKVDVTKIDLTLEVTITAIKTTHGIR